MLSAVATLLLLPPLLYIVRTLWSWYQNVLLARSLGLPYVILPFYYHAFFWQVIGPLLYPVLNLLPDWLAPRHLSFLDPDWSWAAGYDPYRRLKSNTILVATPNALALSTCSAEVISQVATRRQDFPKYTALYGLLEIYGPNVFTLEGAPWRRHRRITAPLFNEKNNEIVWTESLRQIHAMLEGWLGPHRKGTVDDGYRETMRLTLHVISRAGFGVALPWPEEPKALAENEEPVAMRSNDPPPPGHKLSFFDALSSLLTNIVLIFLIPRAILKCSPLQVMRTTARAFEEWRQYMVEMCEDKKKDASNQQAEDKGIDLMAAMVRSMSSTNGDSSGRNAKSPQNNLPKDASLSAEEVMGNAFIFILAGHETTAAALYHSLVFLAMYPAKQARLQEELDLILGDRPASAWTYEEDLPKLLGSMAAAVMNETLRLLPPGTELFKCVGAEPQPLTIDGRTVVLPPHVRVFWNVVAAHRNPGNWPPAAAKKSQAEDEDDLDEFRPERWFVDEYPSTAPASSASGELDHDDEQVSDGDTLHRLLRPQRGAFLAFSEGARACIGKRFAQVELMATLAYLFRHHSVELAVDDYATDDEVAGMPSGSAQRRAVWEKARGRAQHLLTKGMTVELTLQMTKGKVPIHVTKRGEERFWFMD